MRMQRVAMRRGLFMHGRGRVRVCFSGRPFTAGCVWSELAFVVGLMASGMTPACFFFACALLNATMCTFNTHEAGTGSRCFCFWVYVPLLLLLQLARLSIFIHEMRLVVLVFLELGLLCFQFIQKLPRNGGRTHLGQLLVVLLCGCVSCVLTHPNKEVSSHERAHITPQFV